MCVYKCLIENMKNCNQKLGIEIDLWGICQTLLAGGGGIELITEIESSTLDPDNSNVSLGKIENLKIVNFCTFMAIIQISSI